MIITYEDGLYNFRFWGGARSNAKYLTWQDFRIIEHIFEDMHPDGMTETQINDIFWFEEDWIADMLGYNSFEELINDRD